jgi:signal transduction histidine kinase
MAVKSFDTVAALPKIAELAGHGLARDEFLHACLDVLCGCGFERARFYERFVDAVLKRERLVLTDQSPDHNAGQPSGWLVDWSESTVARLGTGLEPAVCCWGDPGVGAWVQDLDLVGKCWVEIPLTAAEQTIGLLACDWSADSLGLESEDLPALRVAGALIGAHLTLRPRYLLKRYRDSRPTWSTDPHKMVLQAAEHIADDVDAASVAVFSFRWSDQSLTKVHERFAPHLRVTAAPMELPEDYKVGEHLTGQAWHSEDIRHVADFKSLDGFGPELTAPDSDEWHRRVFGSVSTVMYNVVGGLDKRYLVRFINRARRADIPFLSEAAAVDVLFGELRSDFDAALATQRSELLNAIAATDADVGPAALTRAVASALRHEEIENFAVVTHQPDASHADFILVHGHRLDDALGQLGEWSADSLYSAAIERDAVFRLSNHRDRSALADALGFRGYQAVMSLPIRTGRTQGAFLIPLDIVPEKAAKKRFERPKDCSHATITLMRAYAHLIGDAVETRGARAKQDGARRALGLIGHELRGPLARVNSEAELAVNVARRVLLEVDGRDSAGYQAITAHLERMWDSQRRVSVALELAPLVAQESEGSLQMHFEMVSLSKLLRDTIQDVEEELRLERHVRPVYFNLARSARQLSSIICDPVYMGHVYKNVLRNAVKYSLPRHRGEPIQIDVFGEPQSAFIAVKVRNWGLGIPPDLLELIFEPWVRGDVHDVRKSIGGMGLGLHLVRRILSAHGGTARATSSPTLDDPRRVRKMEGFITEFELRLPRGLEEGTHTHQWKTR